MNLSDCKSISHLSKVEGYRGKISSGCKPFESNYRVVNRERFEEEKAAMLS